MASTPAAIKALRDLDGGRVPVIGRRRRAHLVLDLLLTLGEHERETPTESSARYSLLSMRSGSTAGKVAVGGSRKRSSAVVLKEGRRDAAYVNITPAESTSKTSQHAWPDTIGMKHIKVPRPITLRPWRCRASLSVLKAVMPVAPCASQLTRYLQSTVLPTTEYNCSGGASLFPRDICMQNTSAEAVNESTLAEPP